MPDKNALAKNAYKDYFSQDEIKISKRDYYTDDAGYPNSAAFNDFAKSLYELEDGNSQDCVFYLVTMNVDLRKSNAVNTALGDYVLRRFYVDIQSLFNDTYIFRIQGEKFNVLVKDDKWDSLKEFLDNKSESYEVYYGCTKEKYIYTRNNELIQQNIILMYRDKQEKKNARKAENKIVIGNAKNTPVELRETDTRKYVSTMWYTIIKVTILKPVIKDFTVYVFPTKLCKPIESIPLVAVVDDFLSYSAFYGSNIVFGVEGVMFMLNARFGRDGHLRTSVYTTTDEASCDFDVNTKEGDYLPVNFGKRIDNGREIYPIKKNISGYFDYVLLDPKKVEVPSDITKLKVTTSGIITVNEKNYGVSVDEECIDLLEQHAP